MHIKTCPRCGHRFEADGHRTVCDDCRTFATKHSPAELLGQPLSPREKQIVELIATGAANKEIAAVLLLSEGTIKVYMSRIFMKAGVSSRLMLALWHLKNVATAQIEAAKSEVFKIDLKPGLDIAPLPLAKPLDCVGVEGSKGKISLR